MTSVSNPTPLIALDTVVIDTETTGLDAAKARIVELAVVPIVHGRIAAEAVFRALIRPDEPIPDAATRIHGIDAAAVAKAPSFAEIWPDLLVALGDKVVIGHTLGFDLAVIKRECERSGIAWRRPRTLDTRLLAEVANPDLAGYSLDQLAAWLGVETGGRHSAMGDAMITAQVFLALLPKLRQGGIRTLAEAEQACRTLTDVLDEQHRAGWVEAVAAPARRDAERSLARIDSYPYRHRISHVMCAPRFVPAETSVGEALAVMARERISSLFVAPRAADGAPRANETGIITERDVLRALAERGPAALAASVGEVMSRPLASVPADAFIYRAIGRMSRLKVRHLGVVDEEQRVIGALSSRDLLRVRAEEALALGDEIDMAEDTAALARAWAQLPRVASGLLAEGVPGVDIAAVISRELGALTRHAAHLAERRLIREGRGPPPCPYAFAVLGSAGRGESLLALDQDNALVFAEGEPGGSADRWFEALGTRVADILHEIGVPYCRGGVMANNPQWRGSVATWRARVADWVRRSDPRDLLSVDIFFDLRAVHGDAVLATSLWRDSFEIAGGRADFVKLLAEAAGSTEPALTMFGRVRTRQGRIDLKKSGLFGIVTLARLLAIRHRVVERATPARLAGIQALRIGADRDLQALIDAQRVFLDLILHQQIDDIDQGLPATNAIVVRRLDRQDRDRLHAALESVRHLEDLARDLLFG